MLQLMAPPENEPKLLTRRSALLAGTATIAGFGGVYGLSRNSTARTQVQSSTTLKDASLTLDPDGNVKDVTMSGSVKIEYESPDIPVHELGAVVSLDHHGTGGYSDAGGSLTKRQRAATESVKTGTHTFTFDGLSLIENMDPLEAADFEPESGETVKHDLLLVANAAIYENEGDEEPLEQVASEDWGYVTVEREQADTGGGSDQEPMLTLTTSEFSFAVETETKQ